MSDDRRRLLDSRAVYETYGEPFTYSWLERKRREGGGPRFLKAGEGRTAKIYYRLADLDSWIEGQLRASTSDTGEAA